MSPRVHGRIGSGRATMPMGTLGMRLGIKCAWMHLRACNTKRGWGPISLHAHERLALQHPSFDLLYYVYNTLQPVRDRGSERCMTRIDKGPSPSPPLLILDRLPFPPDEPCVAVVREKRCRRRPPFHLAPVTPIITLNCLNTRTTQRVLEC